MKPIKDLDKFREQFVRWTLRRASFRWPPRGEALKAARVDRGIYQCNLCKGKFKNKEIKVDHVEPVVPVFVRGAVLKVPSLEQYVSRMFPEVAGFQVLCKTCHDSKTKRENEERRANKKRSKARSRQADVELVAMEGSGGAGEGYDVRGKEVLTEWVAFCPECAGKVYSGPSQTLVCSECRRTY